MREDWLRLALTPGIGTRTLEGLLEHFGNVRAICKASPAELKAAGLSQATAAALASPDADSLARSERWLAAGDQHFLHWQDPRYPDLLLASGQAPPGLFVAGDAEALCLPQIAVVGSRSATPGGAETAQQFASALARTGIVITSGLAQGIDAAAHRGALRAAGQTIAVLGTGPDLNYPRQHAQLAEQVRNHGALVTELPPGTEAHKHQFPRRNRIISGLALGTLVVEAGARSGSLITARYAGEQGREVFAIPGSIHSPLSKGCHQLIRQGAKLVETAADIIEELGPLAGALAKSRLPSSVATQPPNDRGKIDNGDEDYIKLLTSMGHDPLSIDQLAERTGLTAGELSSMLLILELDGRVDTLPGGRFQQRLSRD